MGADPYPLNNQTHGIKNLLLVKITVNLILVFSSRGKVEGETTGCRFTRIKVGF